MEASSPALLDTLFEQGELHPGAMLPCPAPFPASDPGPRSSEKALEEWAAKGDQGLNKSEPEDVLGLLINPNAVYHAGGASGSPDSDSGISDEPPTGSPPRAMARQPQGPPPAIYQVVCDIGGLESEPLRTNVISIQLDDWSSPMLIPDTCVVEELPPIPRAGEGAPTPTAPACLQQLQLPDLLLTEEERRLLTQEGVSLPSGLPLTKVRRQGQSIAHICDH
uniref:cAMP responsive element binding protein 3 like 4 n=1 Tax=Crocodylus porosus TaxID=8502 RepID=A0A7M4E336_CROPO